MVPCYSVGPCCLWEMDFYLGICGNQQQGICWCTIREGGYLTASQSALSCPVIISHPKLFFWCNLGNTKADGTLATKSYFPPITAKIMASSPITSWQIDGETVEQWVTLFCWAPKSLKMVTAAMKLKDAYSLEGKLDQPRQHIKKQRHYFANKGSSSQGYGFSSSHVWM